jgi:hypothetical protein
VKFSIPCQHRTATAPQHWLLAAGGFVPRAWRDDPGGVTEPGTPDRVWVWLLR